MILFYFSNAQTTDTQCVEGESVVAVAALLPRIYCRICISHPLCHSHAFRVVIGTPGMMD